LGVGLLARVETGSPILRRGPVSLSRVEPGSRGSEELRLPCSGGTRLARLRRAPSALFRWVGVAEAPKSSGFLVPMGWGRRGSEELRVPCPGGERRPAPRGVLVVVLR
jgi:hypothetical protein